LFLNENKEIFSTGPRLRFKDLLSITYRKRLFVGCTLSALQQFSGINAFSFYSNEIFLGTVEDTRYSYAQVRNLSVLLSAVNLAIPLAVTCTGITTKFGRRDLLLVGTSICFVSLIVFPLASSVILVSRVTIFVYAIGFGISLGPIVWVYLPEILPDIGLGVAVLVNWLSGMVVVEFYPLLPFGMYNFLVFAGFCGMGLVFVGVFVRETRYKTPAEVAVKYLVAENGKNGKSRVEERLEEKMGKEVLTMGRNSLSVKLLAEV